MGVLSGHVSGLASARKQPTTHKLSGLLVIRNLDQIIQSENVLLVAELIRFLELLERRVRVESTSGQKSPIDVKTKKFNIEPA